MTPVHLWHAACWAAVQTLPPQRAARLAGLVGKRLRQWSTGDAASYARALRGGTCLSRSLAIASRIGNARVAIGAEAGVAGASVSRFVAHAWVEVDGVPLIASEATGPAIAHLVFIREAPRVGNDGLNPVCSEREVFDA